LQIGYPCVALSALALLFCVYLGPRYGPKPAFACPRLDIAPSALNPERRSYKWPNSMGGRARPRASKVTRRCPFSAGSSEICPLPALYTSQYSFRKVLKPGLQFLGSFKAAIAEMTTVTTPNSKRNFMISIFGYASSLLILTLRARARETPERGSLPPALSAYWLL
jgi:hypothetical protein